MDAPNFQREEYTFLIRLSITPPIGISSAERSFSVLRRIKNFMRSTFNDESRAYVRLASISNRTWRHKRTFGWPQLAIERDLEQLLWNSFLQGPHGDEANRINYIYQTAKSCFTVLINESESVDSSTKYLIEMSVIIYIFVLALVKPIYGTIVDFVFN